MKSRLLLPVFGLVLGAVSPGAHAQVAAAVDSYIADAAGYNLVSLGNVTFNQVSDTAGGVAIDGAFTIDNNATTLVGMSWAGSAPSLYATGQLAISSGQTVKVNNGYASTPGATGWIWSGSPADNLTKSGQGVLHYNSGMTQDPTNPANNPNWNWSALTSQFESISATLNAATPTGTIGVNGGGNLVLNPNGASSGVVVFNLDASHLAGNQYFGQTIQNFAINVPNNLTYVINVTNLAAGASFLSGVNVNSGSNDGQLLWNFSGSTDGNFTFANGGKFYGSVLAPDLTLTSDTYQEGQVVVGGLTQNQDELDFGNYLAEIAIPEPAAGALWLGIACALAAGMARRFHGAAQI